jgi:hypothetical protein
MGRSSKRNGSILNLTTGEIVTKLIQHGLAPQSARRCVELFEEVDWHNARLPLRQWLEGIRDFYYRSGPVQKACSSPTTLRTTASVAARGFQIASGAAGPEKRR